MNQWYCVRGMQLIATDKSRQNIQFYIIESSKPKALIAASQAKTLYVLQHPLGHTIDFDFSADPAVIPLGKDWSPNELPGGHENTIFVIAPYAGNGNQLQVIDPSAAG